MKPLRILLLLSTFTLLTDAAPIPDDQAVRAIVGEASGEGYRGMLAVSCALRNRGTLKGVYGVSAKHVDKEPKWVWDQARKAWAESAKGDITGGSTHWEGTRFKTPPWAKRMTVTTTIGRQRFYRP